MEPLLLAVELPVPWSCWPAALSVRPALTELPDRHRRSRAACPTSHPYAKGARLRKPGYMALPSTLPVGVSKIPRSFSSDGAVRPLRGLCNAAISARRGHDTLAGLGGRGAAARAAAKAHHGLWQQRSELGPEADDRRPGAAFHIGSEHLCQLIFLTARRLQARRSDGIHARAFYFDCLVTLHAILASHIPPFLQRFLAHKQLLTSPILSYLCIFDALLTFLTPVPSPYSQTHTTIPTARLREA